MPGRGRDRMMREEMSKEKVNEVENEKSASSAGDREKPVSAPEDMDNVRSQERIMEQDVPVDPVITVKIERKKWGPALAMLSGLLFLLLFSSWTSPIFKGSYGYDSAFFSMAGRAILNGKVMYRDYFDIKGPVFFFWEALGQLIHTDRIGINFLQVICILGATYFLYRICEIYSLNAKQKIFVFFSMYFVYATTLWGGNSVEEYCLPLNMACIYHGLKYLRREKENLDIAFFYGLTFGICALSKVTVAAPMCSIVLVIIIDLIRRKKMKELARCALLFLGGVLIVAVPVFVYYIARGALDDMLLCVFKVAFDRGTDYYEGFSVKWELYLTVCYMAMIYWFVRYFRKKDAPVEKWVLLSMIIVIYLALHLGTPFDYYFTTTLPLLTFLAILHCRDVNSAVNMEEGLMPLKVKKRFLRGFYVAFGGILIVFGAYWEKTSGKVKENWKIFKEDSEYKFYQACKEAYETIPEGEKDDLFCVESGMIFYEVNQILPMSKYPVNMPYFCELYPPAEEEILDTLNNHTPKWLVADRMDEVDNDNIKNAVYEHYEMILENSMQQVWRRK